MEGHGKEWKRDFVVWGMALFYGSASSGHLRGFLGTYTRRDYTFYK